MSIRASALILRGFIIATIGILVVGCDGNNASDPSSRESRVYNRVLKTNKIRVAYITYPPSFIKDANTGKYSGIMHDVLQEMAKRLGIEVDYVEETAWGTMIEAITGQRVDLVCTGLWPNATRGKFVDFTEPVYFSPIDAYVKAGNSTFDGNLEPANSKGVTIAAIDGEMTSIIAAADFPNATVHALPQTADISQLLLEVGTGKSQITFVEPAVADEFVKKNPHLIEKVKGVRPVRVFPNVMMIAKNEEPFLSMLNIALAEIANDGTIDRILNKYEKTPGLLFRRQLPYRTSSQ